MVKKILILIPMIGCLCLSPAAARQAFGGIGEAPAEYTGSAPAWESAAATPGTEVTPGAEAAAGTEAVPGAEAAAVPEAAPGAGTGAEASDGAGKTDGTAEAADGAGKTDRTAEASDGAGKTDGTEEAAEALAAQPSYTQEELFILAHLLAGEAQNCPDEEQLYVGSVVLNRRNHPSFPNSIEGVVFQKGQYSCVRDGNYYREPTARNWENARRLLEEGSVLPPQVVWQSGARQGKGVYLRTKWHYYCY